MELSPKEYAAYSNRGAALNEQNQFEPALADLNKALALKPNDARTLERRGLVYHKQKNYDAALADFNNALTQNPASTLGLRRRADTYVAMGQYAKALPDLEQAVKLKPDDFAAQDQLNFVRAKAAPPRAPAPPAAATPTPTPAPTPVPPLLTKRNAFIGIGGLIALLIVIVLIAKAAMSRRSVD